MRSRASTLRRLFVVLLVVGVIGSVIVGIEAGRSATYSTALFFTTATTSTRSTGRGVTVGLVGLALTVTTTLPLLGISWLIDGQAALLEETA
jgi:hypothetical protein